MMSEGIQLFLLSQAFVSAAALIGIYLNIRLKLRELEIRVTSVENHDKAIMRKLEQIGEGIHEIKIQMENKQDRL